jgi:hypothetical protein
MAARQGNASMGVKAAPEHGTHPSAFSLANNTLGAPSFAAFAKRGIHTFCCTTPDSFYNFDHASTPKARFQPFVSAGGAA